MPNEIVTDPRARMRIKLVAGPGAAVVVLVTGTLLLSHYGSRSLTAGFATGGLVVVLAALVTGWRAVRHADRVGSFARVVVGLGDERDQRLLTESLAVVGVASLPLTAVVTLMVALGVPAEPALAALVWVLLGLLITTAVIITRRR